MKEIYRLIYQKDMLCYSCDFVPQLRSSSTILESKQRKLTGPLILEPPPPKTLAGFVFHPYLKSKS